MKVIELDELKSIQLDIVEAFHEFCINNNIKYSLACGSLLGAIRHNGYIPWDDDIDVYLERKDYNELIKKFPETYKNTYNFISLERDRKWNLPYGKLFDNRTVILEDSEYWIPIGVNIDIFPVDSVPDDNKAWMTYNKKRIILRDIIQYKYLRPNKTKSLMKNIILTIINIIFSFITKRNHSRIVSWYAKRFNTKKTNKLFENVQGIFQKNPFDKKDFEETILHKFENRELYVMKGYDHYLKCGFGNYMQLPPIEKRISHHNFHAYWKE